MSLDRRIQKINNLLREEISKTLDRELDFPEGSFVTVTRTQTSYDKHYAVVFLSIISGEPKKILEILRKNVYNIQQIINHKVRMRPVPKISFSIDGEEMRREEIEKSLAGLKRKGEI